MSSPSRLCQHTSRTISLSILFVFLSFRARSPALAVALTYFSALSWETTRSWQIVVRPLSCFSMQRNSFSGEDNTQALEKQVAPTFSFVLLLLSFPLSSEPDIHMVPQCWSGATHQDFRLDWYGGDTQLTLFLRLTELHLGCNLSI